MELTICYHFVNFFYFIIISSSFFFFYLFIIFIIDELNGAIIGDVI